MNQSFRADKLVEIPSKLISSQELLLILFKDLSWSSSTCGMNKNLLSRQVVKLICRCLRGIYLLKERIIGQVTDVMVAWVFLRIFKGWKKLSKPHRYKELKKKIRLRENYRPVNFKILLIVLSASKPQPTPISN